MVITYYAGAADAAGAPRVELDASDLTAGQLTELLGRDNARLADVLPRCTLLVDGTAVRDPRTLISARARIDVLPPFAGG
ncbi:MAG TPA: MoaD/ThiS family protein [Propionicimonas sp.]|jgi:molybdopterin converting factor small subunit